MRRGIPGMNLHCFERKFFHSSPPIQLPSPMEAHLWYVKPCQVRSDSLLSQYWDILSPCEKETVLRMRGDELRKSALLSRVLVRTTIARYLMNSQVDWCFSDDCQSPLLHFNISHSTSLVACGVTVNSQIGIDVEEKHRSIKHSILSFAKRYFSEHEVQFLAAITDPKVQRQEFIKLWTLKEAYVKALGKGFSGAPFRTFTIRFNGATGESVRGLKDLKSVASEIAVYSFDDPSNLTSHWQFLLWELAGSHYAAICTEKHCATEEGFPAADVQKELNPGLDKDFQVDLISLDVAASNEIQEQIEAMKKAREQENKDAMQSFKTTIIVSSITVVVAGAVFAIAK